LAGRSRLDLIAALRSAVEEALDAIAAPEESK